jgi:hypothetical protein
MAGRDPDVEPLTQAQRRRLAVDLFNHTWTLLGAEERTPEQDDEMIHSAHASRYHWGEVGTRANFGRGEWQISRVYCILGRGEPALHHAHCCLTDILEGDGTEDWDLPFAYEALARAAAVAGDGAGSVRYEELAREAGAAIAEEDDREHFFEELATLPGR